MTDSTAAQVTCPDCNGIGGDGQEGDCGPCQGTGLVAALLLAPRTPEGLIDCDNPEYCNHGGPCEADRAALARMEAQAEGAWLRYAENGYRWD